MSSSGNELWPLPTSWTWVTMSDVSEVVGGGTPDTKISENFGGDIPWVTPADMSTHVGKSISGGSRSLTEQGFAASGARWLPKGAILFSSRAPIGYTAIASQPVTTNQGFKSFVLADEILPDYAYYWLSSAKEQAEKLASGTTFLEISGAKAALLPFPLAPKPEQSRIVEKLEELLSDLDAGVTELKAAQRKLEQYRQSLLKAAVEGALTADWRAAHGAPQETGAELLQRILSERRARWEQKQLAKFAKQGRTAPKGWQAKYPEPVPPDLAELPPLPDAWVWASLDMLGEIASGVAKGTKRVVSVPTREVPYLRVANVQRGYLDLTQIKTIEATESDIAELRLEPGDVLFNEGGDLDKLGRGWVWCGEIPECIHQNHVFRMRPILSATPSKFISHHGNTFGKEWFKNAGKQTTNLASINMTMLRAFPVPVPPELESREVIALLEPLLAATAEQEKSIERGLVLAAAQRKNVLKAAFAGQLVLQDPNDEPVSALLGRVRANRAARQRQPKARKTTKQKEPTSMVRKLVDVLNEAADWVPAQEAFRRCGITDGALTDQVEGVYIELRELDKAGSLQVEVVADASGNKLHDLLKLRTL